MPSTVSGSGLGVELREFFPDDRARRLGELAKLEDVETGLLLRDRERVWRNGDRECDLRGEKLLFLPLYLLPRRFVNLLGGDHRIGDLL